MPSPALGVLDVGNTSVKAVIFRGDGSVLRAWRLPPPSAPAALFLAHRRRLRSLPLVAVSVHPGRLAAIRRRLGGPRIRVLGREIPLAAANRTARPRETGPDRLCAAAAAHERSGGAAVVAGVGTALTVDAVRAGGAFLGGAVAPGLRSAAAGLRKAAPRLPAPDLAPGRPAPFPGRTTRAALRAGFLLGFAGMIDRLAAEAAAAAGSPPRRVPVFLHGGDAPAVLPHLRTPVVHAPHLVAEGARILWLEAGGGFSRIP